MSSQQSARIWFATTKIRLFMQALDDGDDREARHLAGVIHGCVDRFRADLPGRARNLRDVLADHERRMAKAASL